MQLRKSRQRDRILEMLRGTGTHPTADWLYERLKKEFPRLSLGTVYRNLSVLTEQGLVRKIHFGSTHDRFEANIGTHYHFVCRSCGKIVDLDMPVQHELNEEAKKLTASAVHHHKLEFYGICASCQQKGKGLNH